jgi:hypothetical protein
VVTQHTHILPAAPSLPPLPPAAPVSKDVYTYETEQARFGAVLNMATIIPWLAFR